MKNTDKVTLTIGQIKKLIKESKLNETLNNERLCILKIADEIDTVKYWNDEIFKYEKNTNSKTPLEIRRIRDSYESSINTLNDLVTRLVKEHDSTINNFA